MEEEGLESTEGRDLVTERKAVVFEGNMRELAMMKPVTTCTVKGCSQPVSLNTKYSGTAIYLKWIRGKGDMLKKWCSQPKVKGRLSGDFLLAAAILTSGNNYEKVKLLFRFLTFFHIQGKHCIPIITDYFQDMQKQGKGDWKTVTIAGDGRNDSPGHRAGIEIGEVVTDASTTIAAMISEFCVSQCTWIQHLINHFWYCCRLANGSESTLLASWRGILHHTVGVHEWGLGDGAAEARCYHGTLEETEETKWLEPGGDAHKALTRVILDTKLLHSLRHYVNFRNASKCILQRSVDNSNMTNQNLACKVSDMSSYIVLSKYLSYNNKENYVRIRIVHLFFIHTGELETFHEAILMYCAKRYAYTYPIYKARNMLAALDYQHQKDRPLLKTKTGEPPLHRTWSKRSSTWSTYQEREPKQYQYIPEMMIGMIEDFKSSDTPLTAPSKMSPSDPRKLKRTLAPESPPPTKFLFSEKKSRYIYLFLDRKDTA
ncbi:uncharacterized protein LOC123541393 [Mercenaria mercenaria]|uniref:uncharacterized protein LOC123541393 n=1 Tax=Mercenaria mercenaria TaxID=6596 RepID=UPI00234EBFD5|nr:uncharacterized protein LOC123541393 [Mercenaria mercenaria]